ncbi:MAG: tetratricopeptide repeat protein [Spartobacteria bacterium]
MTRFVCFPALLWVGLYFCVSSAHGQSADALIAKGDPLDKNLHAEEALKYYLPALKEDPDNVDLLDRIARQYRHLMADASENAEKLRLGHLSLDYANRGAELAPKSSEAQLSPAISYGKMLPFMGPSEQVDAAPRIKAGCDRAIELDPENGNAWHILGRWNRTIADIPGVKKMLAGVFFGKLPEASNETAEKCLLKAIAINPRRPIHYIELGHIYLQMGRKEEARQNIEKGLALPNQEKDDNEAKEDGRELLTKLK